MKLICFPHAGGFASYYYFLKRADIKNVDEKILYEYPGRGKKEGQPTFEDFEQAVYQVAEEINSFIDKDEKFIFFGHSMGATFAHEIALLLEERYGKRAELVFLSGQLPPAHCEELKFRNYEDIEQLKAYLLSTGGLSSQILKYEKEVMYFLKLAQQDMRLLETYHPVGKGKLAKCAILYGDQDTSVNEEYLAGWREECIQLAGMKCFEGDHFYLKNCQEEIIDYLNEIISLTI